MRLKNKALWSSLIISFIFLTLFSCGGGGGGDTAQLDLTNFSFPPAPQEFIISGHTVYVVTDNCEYTEQADIITNCLELADEENLKGGNSYYLTYHTEIPNSEQYIIDRVHTTLTRLFDGLTLEWDTEMETFRGTGDELYKDLYDLLVVDNTVRNGEYQLDVWVIDTTGRTTPVYTYVINFTYGILQSISIRPTSPYTGIGLTERLTAVGTYSDGNAYDITNSVTWSSESSDVATINTTTGIVTGVDLGTSLITANLDTITGNSTFTVASNPWSTTDNFITAREMHTATLLTNGKVLVAGGYNNMPLASSELYDPVTNTWSAAGSVNTARFEHTATLLNNGKVLVVGGFTGEPMSGYLSSAELYDPATNTWSAAGSLNTGRYRHTATLLFNGKVLVAGGFGVSSFLSSSEIYDPATNTWSAAGDLSTKRGEHTATLLYNGKVLVVGGEYYLNSQIEYVENSELYDPSTNTWTYAGSLNTARHWHTAKLLFNGKVIVVGGYNYDFGGQLVSCELYDPVNNTWTYTGSLNTARRLGHSATLLGNGKLLVIGGYSSNTGVLDSQYYLSSTEMYDPLTQTWSDAGDLSTVRSRHTATLLFNGKVLVVGGSELSTAELSWTW